MSGFKFEPEFVNGDTFNYIDKEGKSTYSRTTEIVLRLDPNGWVLCWEHARKRQKKISYNRWFIFLDSITDVRVRPQNLHEMIIVVNKNYTSAKLYNFVSEPHITKRWASYLFRLVYWHKNHNTYPLHAINKLLSPLRLDTVDKKFKTTLMYEQWTRYYSCIMDKILKFDKSINLIHTNEEPLDTYLRFAPRPDLEAIFNEISNGQHRIDADQLMDFINTTQSNPQRPTQITRTHASKIIQALEHDSKELSLRGFIKFMVGPLCDQFGSKEYDGEKDKGRPLSHYYIKSSHNTYLIGAQIQAITKIPGVKHKTCMADVEMYRQILLSGCRCIELDCWDGPLGRPVVTHGPIALQRINTLTLWEVCEAIIESAFKTSCYPVVLSLENHCNAQQQEIMVQIFKTVFGSHLVSHTIDGYPLTDDSPLPPPEALLYKILLKGTCRRNQKSAEVKSKCSIPSPLALLKQWERSKGEFQQSSNQIDVHLKREKFREKHNDYNEDASNPASPTARSPNLLRRFDALLKSKTPPQTGQFLSPKSAQVSQQSSTDDDLDTESIATVEMNSTLIDLINYFQSSHDLILTDPSYIMHSSSELKIDKTINLHENAFIQHTANHLTRVYPAAYRVDSSNFNPLQYFMAGCQMVSLNFQTHGIPMQFYDAFFDQNYNSGFVAKPQFLCQQQFDNSQQLHAYKLEVQLISAQFIHLLTSKCRKQLDRIVVKLDFYDLPHNLSINKWGTAATFSGSNQGFNMTFEKNTFFVDKIIAPELAMLHIRVLDDNNGKIAQRFLHVDGLKPGYRHIILANRDNRSEPAYLFMKFNLTKYVPEHQPAIRDLYTNPLRERFSSSDESRQTFESRLDAWEKQKKWISENKSATTSNDSRNNSIFYDSMTSNGSVGKASMASMTSSASSNSIASNQQKRPTSQFIVDGDEVNISDGEGEPLKF